MSSLLICWKFSPQISTGVLQAKVEFLFDLIIYFMAGVKKSQGLPGIVCQTFCTHTHTHTVEILVLTTLTLLIIIIWHYSAIFSPDSIFDLADWMTEREVRSMSQSSTKESCTSTLISLLRHQQCE